MHNLLPEYGIDELRVRYEKKPPGYMQAQTSWIAEDGATIVIASAETFVKAVSQSWLANAAMSLLVRVALAAEDYSILRDAPLILPVLYLPSHQISTRT